jgi:hypothetical protein
MSRADGSGSSDLNALKKIAFGSGEVEVFQARKFLDSPELRMKVFALGDVFDVHQHSL